jgi:hypothetical protein
MAMAAMWTTLGHYWGHSQTGKDKNTDILHRLVVVVVVVVVVVDDWDFKTGVISLTLHWNPYIGLFFWSTI